MDIDHNQIPQRLDHPLREASNLHTLQLFLISIYQPYAFRFPCGKNSRYYKKRMNEENKQKSLNILAIEKQGCGHNI